MEDVSTQPVQKPLWHAPTFSILEARETAYFDQADGGGSDVTDPNDVGDPGNRPENMNDSAPHS